MSRGENIGYYEEETNILGGFIMGIARKMLEMSDRKYKEACNENKASKAFMSGAIEGFMDAAIVLYVPLCAALWIAGIKNLNK